MKIDAEKLVARLEQKVQTLTTQNERLDGENCSLRRRITLLEEELARNKKNAELQAEAIAETKIASAKFSPQESEGAEILPAVIFVDGHNTLFALKSRYGSQGAAAQRLLVEDIARATKETPQLRIRIIFDGADALEQHPAENITVIYSGGSGEHRADGVIIEQLRFFENIRKIVCTADAKLAGGARRLGAETIIPVKLKEFLKF